MISIQIDISAAEVEDALVFTNPEGFVEMVVSAVERIGDPKLAKDLIGKLGDTYAYLEETFGDGTE